MHFNQFWNRSTNEFAWSTFFWMLGLVVLALFRTCAALLLPLFTCKFGKFRKRMYSWVQYAPSPVTYCDGAHENVVVSLRFVQYSTLIKILMAVLLSCDNVQYYTVQFMYMYKCKACIAKDMLDCRRHPCRQAFRCKLLSRLLVLSSGGKMCYFTLTAYRDCVVGRGEEGQYCTR